MNLYVLEQNFPKEVELSRDDKKLTDKESITLDNQKPNKVKIAGIGIARKLLMDIACSRKQEDGLVINID
jgi:hypothetical protein